METYRLPWTATLSAGAATPIGARGQLLDAALQWTPLCRPKARRPLCTRYPPTAVSAMFHPLAANDGVAEGAWRGKSLPTLARSTELTARASLNKISLSFVPSVLEPLRQSTNGSGMRIRYMLFELPGYAATPEAHLCSHVHFVVTCILTIPICPLTSISNAGPSLKRKGLSTVATISFSIFTMSTSPMLSIHRFA